MASKSTLSDYLAELGVDINNMQEFLNKLSQMLTTSSDTVQIKQTLQNNTQQTFNVPSFAYLKNKIEAIDSKFNSLLTANANSVGVVDENGQVRRFELQDISQVASDLDSVAGKTVINPVNFNYKTNWFFENFLNPLVYIDLPVDDLVTSDIDKFEVKRVIMTSQDIDDTAYFDSTYKGQNTVNYSELITDLRTRNINHFVDSNEVFLPPSQNKKSGSYNIVEILNTTVTEIVGGEVLSRTVVKYLLNTLRYNEKSATSQNGLIQRTLAVGDRLITKDNSEYVVETVNSSEKSITVKKVFGIGALSKGANQLSIKPQLDPINVLSINVGYNERQVIFLRPISTRLRLSTDNLSQGIGIYSNELTISLGNGQSMKMSEFYSRFVSDFGLLFLSYAKEKKLPASLGDVPIAPVLETTAFTVAQINAQVQDAEGLARVRENVASAEALRAQIAEVDRQISEKRAELQTNAGLSEAQRLNLQKALENLAAERLALTTELSSRVASVTEGVRSAPGVTAPPIYRIKGFWHIPDPKITETGPQNIVQFKIAYRVLSQVGTPTAVEQLTYTDPDGTTTTAAFSPWTEVLSKVRSKKLNTTTGFYEWAPEDVTNPDTVNMNQVEIPIQKGEVVEIKVKSLSEAGFPDNPIESDWSNRILVEFPANLQSLEDISIVAQQAFAEETRLNFQDELNSKGLDLHLKTSFTKNDRYFAHTASDIASGFFAADSSIVDLYTKLQSITDTITSIQTALASDTGKLSVKILDQDGNSIDVTNGQTVNISAGYYKDQIKNTSAQTVGYDHGKVITKQYFIELQNTSQTALELVSTLIGGLGESATTSSIAQPDVYNSSLRYDIAPIVITGQGKGVIGGFRQDNGLQSSQVKGQIVYVRAKDLSLSENLYTAEAYLKDQYRPDDQTIYLSATTQSIPYDGLSIGPTGDLTTVPYKSGHYVPYDPTKSALTVNIGNGSTRALQPNSKVWKGAVNTDVNGAPIGGGLLSEFCISVDHPDIKKNGKYNGQWSSIKEPKPASTADSAEQPRLPFSHGIHFEISQAETTNALGGKPLQQAAYRLPTKFTSITSSSVVNYPIKNSFDLNDKYLIGRYTCGSYLFLAPASHQSIGSTSISPNGAKRMLQYGSGNSIKVPLTFQYRCSDYLGYIGGYRVDTTYGLTNVSYSKKIGIDICLKDELFSFDVQASVQYDKETAVTTPTSGISPSSVIATSNLNA